MTWTHPTGNTPKTIRIMALGRSSVDATRELVGNYAPSIPNVEEVWTLNKGFRVYRHDLLFVLDDLAGEARHYREYVEDILRGARAPVITSTLDYEAAAVVMAHGAEQIVYALPLKEMLMHYGARMVQLRESKQIPDERHVRLAGEGFCLYWRNSIPLMLAYAGFIGVESIQLFGADYVYNGVTVESGLADVMYWIGALRAMGVSIETIAGSNCAPSRTVYGYPSTRVPL